MFIRRKPRKSSKGITFDFYVVASVRAANGPRQKVFGYIGCIQERFLGSPFHCAYFWKSITWMDGSHRKGAKELIQEIVSAQGRRDDEIEKLIDSAAKFVPFPPADFERPKI